MNGIRRARKVIGTGSAAGMLALLVSCGGDGGSGPNGGDANFTATIDGSAFTALAASTVAQISNQGNFAIVGASGTGTSITLILYSIGGPGTYPLGVSGTVRGGLGTVGTTSSSLSTPASGTAGSITISQVSATRIAGTFNFVAGAAPVTKTVTNGSFDLPVTGNGSINVPDFAGSRVDGTINGTPWNAAGVVMVAAPSSGTLGVGFSNLTYQMNLIISGWTGVGTYTMNTGVSRQMTVMATDGSLRLWGGTGGLTTGTFTVVTATATRIGGNYDITLQPAAIGQAAGNLHLVGTFDIGIQP
jgi:hypothetical protein